MSFTEKANKVFIQAIRDYHLKDDVDTPLNNPYERETIEFSLYTNVGLIPFSGTWRISFATHILTPQKH